MERCGGNVVVAEEKETWWKGTSASAEGNGRERDDRRECHSVTAEGNAKAAIAEGNVVEGERGGGECQGRREEGKGTGMEGTGTSWRERGHDRRDGNVSMTEENVTASQRKGTSMAEACHGSRRREEGKGTGYLERRELAAEVN